jgi:hypothetical protein
MAGSTQGTVQMGAGTPAGPCPPLQPGDDIFPSTAKLVLELFDDVTGQPFVLRLSSAGQPDSIVTRLAPTLGNTQTVPIELVQLSLTGSHPRVGDINVRAGDVIVEIDVAGTGETWSCDRPLRLETRLTELPPTRDVKYENPFLDPVILVDNQTGDPRGRILPFCQESLWLRGDFRVLRDALATDPTGQTFFATLMAKAVFEGDSQCVGPVSLGLNPGAASGGQVQPLTPEERFPADSFFDIFLRMDTGIGPLSTSDPTRMTTTINALPPDNGEIYFGPGTIIPLFDDTGQQVGEILEVSHEVHETIECPPECMPRAGFPDVDNKKTIHVAIPGAGGGVQYDISRGTLSVLRSASNNGTCILTGGSCTSDADCAGGNDHCRGDFSDATCVQDDGNGIFFNEEQPPPGDGFYFIGRDVFGAFQGTYNGTGVQQKGNRDPRASAPNAPGACPLP